jgi:ribosomal protein L11 methyltransferase
VLSIAAAKLGASRIVAIELDADAIENAEENVRRNGVGDRVSVIEGDAASLLPLVAPVRVVTANIISSVLIDLLPTMASALEADGCAILSGILVSERSMMVERSTPLAGASPPKPENGGRPSTAIATFYCEARWWRFP